MNKTPVLLLIFVIAAIMTAGCTTRTPAPQPAPATLPPTVVATTIPSPPAVPAQLAGTWVVTRMGVQDGTAVMSPTTEITLTVFTDGTLAGYSGCNNYNGPFTLTGQITPKGNGIAIGPVASTKKFCQAYADQETMYLAILQKAVAYNVDGSHLSITASTGDVLVYQTPASIVTPVQYPHPA